ncbi:MAG: hypothetical protein JWN03_5290 [Nocardia sp.]|nr:hypothetical protein [Nocardia sp.]
MPVLSKILGVKSFEEAGHEMATPARCSERPSQEIVLDRSPPATTTAVGCGSEYTEARWRSTGPVEKSATNCDSVSPLTSR